MVPHSWILKCLEMVREAKNMITIISNSVMNCKTVLTSGGTDIGQVGIRRGIFQGDSLSPLLFVLIMLPLTLVLKKMRARYRLAKNMNSVNHLLFMDDLKLYGASKDKLDSLVQVARHQDVVWTRQVRGPRNEKRKTGWQQWNKLTRDDQHIRKVEEEG